jgi:Ca-activated chloride channel homolog
VRKPDRSLAALVTLSAAFAAAVVAAASEQQQTPPTFRGGTETVAIYATALDRGGQAITDLERAEFEVYDDGRRQPLTVFVKGLQPITAVVLVDTSASMAPNLDSARTAAEQFVIRMFPGDSARVGSFSDRVNISPTFTSDRDVLLTALREGLHIGNPTMLWDAIDQTMTSLTPLGGRRVILVLTDGYDTLSQTTGDAVFSRAQADELMVYVVQFRTNTIALMAEEPLAPTAGEIFGGNRRRATVASAEQLRRLSRQTGGGHFTLGRFDDVNATFTQVMQELHYQYVLGFTPTAADGKVHQITVRSTRRGSPSGPDKATRPAPLSPRRRSGAERAGDGGPSERSRNDRSFF